MWVLISDHACNIALSVRWICLHIFGMTCSNFPKVIFHIEISITGKSCFLWNNVFSTLEPLTKYCRAWLQENIVNIMEISIMGYTNDPFLRPNTRFLIDILEKCIKLVIIIVFDRKRRFCMWWISRHSFCMILTGIWWRRRHYRYAERRWWCKRWTRSEILFIYLFLVTLFSSLLQ